MFHAGILFGGGRKFQEFQHGPVFERGWVSPRRLPPVPAISHLEEAVRRTGQLISIILFIINNIFFASGISVPITFERLLQPLPSLFIAQSSRFSSWRHPKLGAEAFDIYSVCLPLSLSFKNPLLLAIKGNRSYRSMMENTSREAAQMDRRC
jgi:hypothetical protein